MFQAHELMSRQELSQVFQVEDHDEVPEYEVVNIHHRRHKRSADNQHSHQVRLSTSFNLSIIVKLNMNATADEILFLHH